MKQVRIIALFLSVSSTFIALKLGLLMPTKDTRIDAYIARSAPFAKPILNHIRQLLHCACPDVEETMKWSFPHFMYNGILCSMAAFKQHCALSFWHPELRKSLAGATGREGSMGNFGRITQLCNLPNDRSLARYIREAARLNASGIKPARPPRPRKPKPKVPFHFLQALRQDKKALAAFEGFSPSHQREYIEWITEAKRDETRNKRIQTAVQWLSQGKSRNWKYEIR